MPLFFDPTPREINCEFVKPRTRTLSESGATTVTLSGVGYWQGTIVPTRSNINADDPLEFVAARDNQSPAFFADLDTRALATTPVWTDTTTATANYFTSASTYATGDIVSIRLSVSTNFVTARVISHIDTSQGGSRYYYNYPISEAFFYGNNAALIQICSNRPHVTAFFRESPVGYRINADRIKTFDNVLWTEDTGAIENELLRLGDQITTPSLLLAENGNFIVTEDGNFIEV